MIAAPALPESCPHRRTISAAGPEGETGVCGLIERLAGDQRALLDTTVPREACIACLQCAVAPPGRINSVVASLLYGAATVSLEAGRRLAAENSLTELNFLQAYASRHLEVVATPSKADQEHRQVDNHAQQPSVTSSPTWLDSARGALHRWSRSRRRWPAVGLLGWNAPTGLGYQNAEIAARLPIDRWLQPVHPRHAPEPLPLSIRRRVRELPPDVRTSELRTLLKGLDWLIIVESPQVPGITSLAKDVGVRVACVCNWEWVCPVRSEWLHDVDLMICPTQHTFRLMRTWKRRFGFAWNLLELPWPIDSSEFRFRLRERCRQFVFVNGWGGCRGRRAGLLPTPYQRKGVELIMEAARRLPRVPFRVYSQTSELPPRPSNVQVLPAPRRRSDLYREGDVCVQPSHWEGIGLQLLECQAAGMPLITTDAPPMNEHSPFRTIPVRRTEDVLLAGDYSVPAQLMDPDDLAATLEAVFETDIREASLHARRFVEVERDWGTARVALRRAFSEDTG